MIRQEVKNALTDAFMKIAKQGRPSGSKEYCRYRSETGLCCIIGMIINDEFYQADFEGRQAAESEVRKSVEKSIGVVGELNGPEIRLMSLAQRVHDTAYNSQGYPLKRQEFLNHIFNCNPFDRFELNSTKYKDTIRELDAIRNKVAVEFGVKSFSCVDTQ